MTQSPAAPDQLARNAAIYREILSRPNNNNPRGLHYRNLTVQDIQTIHPELLLGALQLASHERYDLFDSITPTAMTRPQFIHALLRECGRRGILNEILVTDNVAPNQNVTVRRPLGVPPEQQRDATVNAQSILYRDFMTESLKDPNLTGAVLAPEVALQVGLPLGQTRTMVLDTDMRRLIAAYIAGTDPASQPNGPLPLQLYFNATRAELQAAFCSTIGAIAQPGTVTDSTLDASAGFLMAREDVKTAFQGTNVAFGVQDGTCGSSNVPYDSMRFAALRGVDNATRARP